MIHYNFPFGYEMMQDPEVVASIMRDIAKLMERNCELATENARLRETVCRQRKMLGGNSYR